VRKTQNLLARFEQAGLLGIETQSEFPEPQWKYPHKALRIIFVLKERERI